MRIGSNARAPGGATRGLRGGTPLALLVALLAALAIAGAARAMAPAVRVAGGPGEPAAAGSAAASAARLEFARDGVLVRALDLDALRASCGLRTVVVDDPYYAAQKKFVACPLSAVLEQGFGEPATALRGRDVLLRAADGYTKLASGDVLAGGAGAEGWLAVSDAELGSAERPRWAPIDRRQVDPGPFYLVWTGVEPGEAHRLPWPYELVRIEVVSFETAYPHTVPTGEPADAAAWAGYRIFRSDCFSCHSINGEGGKVGPDLNVPRSIVEYRPVAQIKEYVRDPSRFRYTTMPAHEYLTDRQLDELIAYLDAMRSRKHDPGRPR